jgi:hypothetical protein
MAPCQWTKDYVAKRTAEGKSKREIMRCLKRYAVGEIYRKITNPQAAPDNSDLRQMRTTRGYTITTAARELGQNSQNYCGGQTNRISSHSVRLRARRPTGRLTGRELFVPRGFVGATSSSLLGGP